MSTSPRNHLHHFIRLEGPMVAILATALDPLAGSRMSSSQHRLWTGFARLCHLPLEEAGPTRVWVEKLSMDLLMIWSGWLVLVEVKSKDGHVKQGQLERYYSKLTKLLGKGDFSDAARIAVIFLTPPGGLKAQREFASLKVNPQHLKRHIQWGAVLDLLDNSFHHDTPPDTDALLHWLVAEGSGRIRQLISL